MKYYFNHILRTEALPGRWWGLENVVVEEILPRDGTDYIKVKIVDERVTGGTIFRALPRELTPIIKIVCPMK